VHGNVVRRHDYYPFGEEYAPPPLTPDRLRFTGKERDVETGLDYFGARYYASRTGRFTTVDPGHVGGNIFDPQSWNAYAYARNNPLRFVDPTGTDYRVNAFGGDSFWVQTDRDLEGLEQGGFSFRGGNIFNGAGTWVGTYEYFDPFARLAFDVSRTAGPGLNAALIVSAPNFALAAGVSVAGLGGTLTTVNLTGAAQAAALTLPAGLKLSQMIARSGGRFAGKPLEFLSYARDFVVTAAKQGTHVFANWIGGNGATIYRVGNDHLVVARDGKILSYVKAAEGGRGVVQTYTQLGGK
jgi:RHS repeat-associated protein